ncbi:carboxypeptidase-like regulatory domain-containing protein [Arenibacter sp. BSSL-BM3]|uniref:Carboxypeptidase-like regulatory domain-containing protein n=1 Tax=Arenibacter arenosicollis TaxID=2762274 RepID=A0ABR7QLG3_9FLAO|nr:carboxypeptidase-like regulatory domain-containing protein [Arenibacter arenosicollis]MBC8768033.1 carboxypeptidase-like regulatory domain-containing protein [Arenibacter arenosicollis]
MGIRSNIIAFLILFCIVGHSQESDFVSGMLLDAETIEPISFASIRVKNRAVGVISNNDGSFRIPLKFRELNDTLEITSMGYDSREIIIGDLITDKLNRLYLNPMLIQLDEVTLKASKKRGKRRNAGNDEKPTSAEEIIGQAIKNIPLNYPFNPQSYVGYYRDYQRKSGGYTNLNEAIVEVFDKGFGTSDYEDSNTRIYEYFGNTNFPVDSLSERLYDYGEYKTKTIPKAYLKSYGGNEFVILRIMDAIRNYNTFSYSFVDHLDTDFLKNHDFSLEDDTYLDGKALYVIDIYKHNWKFMVRGKIYISKENFEIVKLEYATYDALLGTRKISKTSKRIEDRLLYRTLVEYKKQDDKMSPSYISFSNKFEVKVPPVFTVKDVVINFEKKHFEIIFNRVPLRFKVLKDKNYNISYKGKGMDIEKVVLADSVTVQLHPKMNLGDQALEIFYSDPADIGKDDFRIVMDNIMDLDGNKLDFSETYSLMQFREFFVQQQKPVTKYPDERLFMDKNWPIFQDQPILKPDNYGDFWMNTPLLNEGGVVN